MARELESAHGQVKNHMTVHTQRNMLALADKIRNINFHLREHILSIVIPT